jgi:hypothetical protein
MRGPGVCGLTELSSSARFGEDAEEPFQPARGCHEDQPASLRHNSAMGMRHAARQKGQATWPNLELLVATLASLIDKNSAESAMLQCHGPHHGNAEQHVTDYEQDRRQSIDDHHAEDDLVTSTLLPAARTAASVMGEPPIGRNVVSAGSTSSASPTARSSSAGDPNGHLDLAPDRGLADLELGGADRAALAQCAEFGQ